MHSASTCTNRACLDPVCLELMLWDGLFSLQYRAAVSSGPKKIAIQVQHDAIVQKFSRRYPYMREGWLLLPPHTPRPAGKSARRSRKNTQWNATV